MGGTFRRQQFGAHAAASQRPRAAGHVQQTRIAGLAPSCTSLAVSILARVTFVKARLVGEDHQQIGFHQVRHQRRQGIVIAKTDFFGRHGVVFVYHRHDTEPEQGVERAARVEVAVAVGEVIVR